MFVYKKFPGNLKREFIEMSYLSKNKACTQYIEFSITCCFSKYLFDHNRRGTTTAAFLKEVITKDCLFFYS